MPAILNQKTLSSLPTSDAKPSAAIPAPQHTRQLDPIRLRRVQTHIAQNWNRDLPVVELAAIACLSPYHFIRCFRHAVGSPPYRYLLMLRLEKAKILLQEPGSSIVQTALECGFSSQASFTRAFSKQVGISPASYRDFKEANA